MYSTSKKKSHCFHIVPSRSYNIIVLSCVRGYRTVVLYYSRACMLSNKRTPEIVYSSAYSTYGTVIQYEMDMKRYPRAVYTAWHKTKTIFFLSATVHVCGWSEIMEFYKADERRSWSNKLDTCTAQNYCGHI